MCILQVKWSLKGNVTAVPGISLTEEEKEAVETRGGRGGKAKQRVVLTAVGTRGIKKAVAAIEDGAAAVISKLIFVVSDVWPLERCKSYPLLLGFAASFTVF